MENCFISDVYGERVNPITGKDENHKGLDFGAMLETPARAVKSGEVIDSGLSNSYGYWVKYKTYDNYEVLYAHLNKIAVTKGQKISQGDVIAYTGNTGQSTGPHLHYELFKDGKNLNPAQFLNGK